MLPGYKIITELVQLSVIPVYVALTVFVSLALSSADEIRVDPHVFPQRALLSYRNKNNHNKECVGAFCAILAPFGLL